MSGSDIRAGRAYVELYLQNSKLMAGLRASQGAVSAFSSTMTRIGTGLAAIGGGIVGSLGGRILMTQFQQMLSWLKSSAESAQETGVKYSKLAAQFNTTSESLSSLSYAAEESGTKLSSLTDGMEGIDAKLAEAAQGSHSAQMAFAQLGLSASALSKMGFDDRLATIADAFARLPSGAAQSAAALSLFGKAGTELLPFLRLGAAGIAGLAGQAGGKGLIVSTEDAETARTFDRAMRLLKDTIAAVGDALGTAVMPLLKEWAERTTNLVKGALDWVRNNKELVQTIFKIGSVILTAGTVFLMAGGALSMIASAIGGFITMLGGIGVAIGAVLSPMGLLIVGIGVLAYKFVDWKGVVGSVVAWAKDTFSKLAEDATKAFGAIRNALAAGDMAAAWRVASTLIQLEFTRLQNAINAMWDDVKDYFFTVWDAVALKFAEVWASPMTSLNIAFIELVAGLKLVWLELIAFMGTSLTPNWVKTVRIGFVRLAQAAGAIDAQSAARLYQEIEKPTTARNDRTTEVERDQIARDKAKALAAIAPEHDARTRDAVAAEKARQDAAKQDRWFDRQFREWRASDSEVAARKAFDDAVAAANAAKANPSTTSGFKGAPGSAGGADIFGATKSVGTFSGRAAGQMFGGSQLDKIATNTRDTRTAVQELIEVMEGFNAQAAGVGP